tara:strand:+ start:12436 stop:12672 length:237 start_codon:yes stop_codon:yes gene_type:complete
MKESIYGLRAFKQVREISKHCKYQLSPQGLHSDMTDFAYKLQEFITSEVMTEEEQIKNFGFSLNDIWVTIVKQQKERV